MMMPGLSEFILRVNYLASSIVSYGKLPVKLHNLHDDARSDAFRTFSFFGLLPLFPDLVIYLLAPEKKLYLPV